MLIECLIRLATNLMSGLMTGALEIGVGCAKAFDADVEEDGVGSEI